MKKIIIMLMAIIMFSSNVMAYDYFQNVTILSKDTPKNGSFDFAIMPLNNETIYFSQIKNEPLVKMNYLNNHTFTNETDLFEMKFYWNITNTIWTENATLIEEIKLTNTKNENVVTLGFQFNLFYSEDSLLEINHTDTIIVVDGVYNREVSVFNLPDEGTLGFNLKGEPLSSFSFDECLDFLQCPINLVYFDHNGTKRIEMPFKIPRDTAIGSYNTSFKIITEHGNQTINVRFHIKVPDLFAKPPTLPEKCHAEVLDFSTQLECEGEIQKYRANLIVEYQNYMANVNTDKICSDYVKYEYVVGDSISEEIMKTNQKLRDENTQLREQKTHSDNIVLNLKSDIIDIQSEMKTALISKDAEIIKIKEDNINRLAQVNYNAQHYVNDFTKSKSKIIKWSAFIIFLVPLLIFVFDTMLRGRYFSSTGIQRKYMIIAMAGTGFIWVVTLLLM